MATSSRPTTSDIAVVSSLVDTLTCDPSTWKGASLLSVKQITPSGLSLLFQVAEQMKTLVKQKGGDNRLAQKVLATCFYEASTRTASSFQVAMQRLGGSVIHVDGQGNSSAKKGESLYDTIRCLECYADVTVLRHSITGSVAQVAANATKPIVNAGDGTGEHPTQALFDLFTICDELNYKLDDSSDRPLTVVLLGDLRHGRTVHSLAKLLARSAINVNLRYCSPDSLQMPHSIQQYVSNYTNASQQQVSDLKQAIDGANALYVTRVQQERFQDEKVYNAVKGSYIVNADLLKKAPQDMIVMHPLPRIDEIATDVDSDPRAAYFRQMENGMYVRMALLALIMGRALPN
jgi:carbamoyl-phosphate synthase/aspartate carbamoyltransferase/dihydroorotase